MSKSWHDSILQSCIYKKHSPVYRVLNRLCPVGKLAKKLVYIYPHPQLVLYFYPQIIFADLRLVCFLLLLAFVLPVRYAIMI